RTPPALVAAGLPTATSVRIVIDCGPTGFSSTPRFGAGQLGEWFRLWIPGREPTILEEQKGNGRKTPDGTLSSIHRSEFWEKS
ncbi:hypothetical protein, partial [Escherichia coli]|uniref:hypothetical protein n=1 Tax=Escherichia coli TaxID=562 RepID=UPI003BA166BF